MGETRRTGRRCAPKVVLPRYRRHIDSDVGRGVVDAAWKDHWSKTRNSKMSDRRLWTTHIQQEEACGLLWYLKFNLRSSYRLNNIRSSSNIRRKRFRIKFNRRNNDDYNTIRKIVWQGTSYQLINLELYDNSHHYLNYAFFHSPIVDFSEDEAKDAATAAMERCSGINKSHFTLTDYNIIRQTRTYVKKDKGHIQYTMTHICLVCNKKSAKRVAAEWYLKSSSQAAEDLPIIKEYKQVMLVDKDATVEQFNLLMIKTEWLHVLDHKMVKCFWDKFDYSASALLSLPHPRPQPIPHPRPRSEPHFYTYSFDLSKADLESSMVATVAWLAVDNHNYIKRDELRLVKVMGGFLDLCWGRKFYLTLRVSCPLGLKTCVTQVWESGRDVWQCSFLTEASERKDQYWTCEEYDKNFKCEDEDEDEDEEGEDQEGSPEA